MEPKSDTPLFAPSSSRYLPDFKKSTKLEYVKLAYHYLITFAMFFVSPLLVVVVTAAKYGLRAVVILSTLLASILKIYFDTRPEHVEFDCVEFDCAKQIRYAYRKCTKKTFVERSRMAGFVKEKSLDFQRKILESDACRSVHQNYLLLLNKNSKQQVDNRISRDSEVKLSRST